jgi:hypothetical protein
VTHRQVVYREIVEIDGQIYTLSARDYTDSIAELIADQIIDPDCPNSELFDYVASDLETNP